jgi:lipopolysaccharide transport system ATP-binding protein
MSNPVIKIENLSKVYRLGEVGTGTLSHDLNRFWRMNVLGQDDPYAKVGQVNDRTQKAQKGEHISALRDINLEVHQGEVLGIIGKNGAGKSTLLKLLSRVTGPTTGSIKVKGRLASLLEVGTGFNPEMTGRENIYMNGTIMGMRRWEITRKLDEIVEFAGVAKYLDTPTKRYSSGMTVRLGFAIAAHLEPEILVVDEVLAVGDAEFQKKAIGKMQDVSTNDGRTVLFVSHNMASVQTLCSRGIIIKDGELNMMGEIPEIINAYLIDNENEVSKYFKRSEGETYKLVCIDSVNIEKDKNPTSILLCGDNATIITKYSAKEEGLKASLHIGIYNAFEEKILHVSTNYSNYENFLTKKNGIIECTIPRLPLAPGRYSVNISFQINNQPYDSIKRALSFDVESGDFYGNGKLPLIKENKFLVDQKWKII